MRKDWIKIKNDYITHEISLEELAKKYKASLSQVKKHCSEESWVKLKEEKKTEIEQKTDEILTKKSVDRKVAANEKSIEQFDKLSKIIDMTLESYMNTKDKTKIKPYNLDYLASIITKIQKGQRLSLNIGANDNADSEPEVRIIKGLDEDKI